MKVIESDKVAPLFRLLLMNNKYADAIIHDVQEVVNLQSIDPVYDAGACYCRECKHWDMEICDGSELTWGKCHKALDCYGNSSTITDKTDFCSRGKRRELNDKSIL